MRVHFTTFLLWTCLFAAVLAHGTSRWVTYHTSHTRSLAVIHPTDPTQTGKVNMLFRSNVPENHHRKFLYDRLLDEMVHKALVERSVLVERENVYMVIFSLVEDDDPMLKDEHQYFLTHPEKGVHTNYPIQGEKLDPSGMSEKELREKSHNLEWMADDMEAFVARIRKQLLDFSSDKSVFVVIHCRHGHDRTGQVAAAYNLRYGGLTWEQTNALNYEVTGVRGSALKNVNQRAIMWYCHHLQFHLGYDQLSCHHINTNKKNKARPPMVHWDQPVDWSLMGPIIGLSMLSFVLILILLGLVTARVVRRARPNWNPRSVYSRECVPTTDEMDEVPEP